MGIFISHSWKDKPKFDELVQQLNNEGVPYWDPTNIGPGPLLSDQLLNEIERSEVCIFIATDEAVRSSWCNAELGAFWGAGKHVLIYAADSSLTTDNIPRQFHGHFLESRMAKVIEAAQGFVSENKEYSGEWYAAHTSRAERGQHAISAHRYRLKFYSTGVVKGEMIDRLGAATFTSRVEGRRETDGRLVLVLRPPPENDQWLMGAQFHSELSQPTEINVGTISSFDRNNRPFSAYIALCKKEFGIDEFKNAVERCGANDWLFIRDVPENLPALLEFPRFEDTASQPGRGESLTRSP